MMVTLAFNKLIIDKLTLKDVFRILVNVQDGGFCGNSEHLLVVSYVCKTLDL